MLWRLAAFCFCVIGSCIILWLLFIGAAAATEPVLNLVERRIYISARPRYTTAELRHNSATVNLLFSTMQSAIHKKQSTNTIHKIQPTKYIPQNTNAHSRTAMRPPTPPPARRTTYDAQLHPAPIAPATRRAVACRGATLGARIGAPRARLRLRLRSPARSRRGRRAACSTEKLRRVLPRVPACCGCLRCSNSSALHPHRATCHACRQCVVRCGRGGEDPPRAASGTVRTCTASAHCHAT